MDNSKIEWTDATWQPITGCTLVSEGCRNCYAATLAATRLKNHPSRKGLARVNANGEAKFTGEVRLNEQWLDQPLRWRKPRMIFVCAHGDLFHEAVPDEWIDRVFAVMALASQHTFQVLTKRPERARDYLAGRTIRPSTSNELTRLAHIFDAADKVVAYGNWATFDLPLPNVWLGTSVEDQATADARIPHLLATPAAVRFVSAEPLLGWLDLTAIDMRGLWLNTLTGEMEDRGAVQSGLDWVIVGGESGPKARVWPDFENAARSLRDQCQAARVSFFMKQMAGQRKSSMPQIPDDLLIREFPDAR
jgi:protein gp37